MENQAKNGNEDIVKANTGRRGNDFGSSMADTESQNENLPPSKRSTRSDMEQHWQFEDRKEIEKKMYKTAGDGMGGRKGGNPTWMQPEEEKKMYKTAGDGMGGRNIGARSWGIGDESDPEVDADVRPSVRGRRTQAQAGASDF